MLDQVTTADSVLRRSYAFDRLGAAAAVLDASGVIVETNETWRIFAALNEALPGTTGLGVDYLHVCDRSFRSGVESAGAVAIGLRSILSGERGSFELEYPCPSPIEDRWFLLHASTAPVEAGAGLVLFHVNITARKLLEERLGDASHRDPWTGLPDRRAGMRLIEDGLARAESLDTRLTLIKLGIAGLGAVDDELGRPALEELAVQVTARARRALRADDRFCQLGPDELVVVCGGLDDAAAAEIVARLEHAMSAAFQVGSTKVQLRVDVGVASAEVGSTAIGLLAAASTPQSAEIRSVRRAAPPTAAIASAPNDVRGLAASLPGGAAASPMRIARAQRDAVVANSNDLALYLEPDGTIAWASPAIKSVLGIDPASLVGRSGFDMIHPDDRERTLAELGTVVNLGDRARTEHRVITDDGTVLWVEESVTNLVDDPYVGYIVVNLHDITERKLHEQVQAQLSAIVAYSTAAIISSSLDGIVETWNEAAVRLFGYTADEIVGRSVALTVPADRADEVQQQLDVATGGGRPAAGMETRSLRADGTEFDASITISAMRGAQGQVTGTSRVVRDISAEVGMRRHLELDRRRLADAQQSAHLGSFEFDDASQTMSWSAELTAILGLSPQSAQSLTRFRDRIHPDDKHALDVMLSEANRGLAAECTCRVVRPDGEIRWVAARSGASDDAGFVGVSGTLLDITERKQLELDLRHQATHDALTGLANRGLLLEQLETALGAGHSATGVAVILLDVDRFKLINDSFGHDRGDLVLVAIADVLRATLGARESAARFDSDAFAVVMRGCNSSEQALEHAARIRAALAGGVTVGADRFHPTFSVGIVVARPGDSAMTSLRNAETAMYRAKEQGRDRAACFDPSQHRNVIDRFELERDLRRGIECDQLHVVFQPVVDLQTDSITSCEALVRWHHPERGTIQPDDFIPVAEETRLIVPLGRWVLRHSLAVAANWPEAVQVAVNLSALELAEPDLVAFVHSVLVDLDVPASRLILEITETAVIHDPTAAARTIGALRALGVSVVIDDFGTGYTSLSFLRDYQIDGLKIDRSFVANLDHGSAAIIDAIIRMSAAFGLKVIAEGIETEAELAELRALGCRFIQGYLISRPVEADALSFMQTAEANDAR